MFRIGEFSRIAQVSASQLRNYDQLGLFKPEAVDPQTGYRLYSASQLPQLNRIIALKEMGLSLAQIETLVNEQVSPDELRGMLLMKKAQIEQTVQQEAARLRYIQSRIEQIDLEGEMTDFDIVLKSIPAKDMLSLRAVLPVPQAARGLLQEMRGLMPASIGKGQVGKLLAIMHSDSFAEANIDIELGFELQSPFAADFQLNLSQDRMATIRKLPAEPTMLTVIRLGHPRLAHSSYSALGRWAQANGFQLRGPVREVFIQPAPPERIHEAVTEIQYPAQPIPDGAAP